MLLALKIIGVILVIVLALFVVAILFGNHLRKKGQRPFDASEHEATGAKNATTADGRHVDYFVYGSTAAAAPVVINLHGSGPDASFEKNFYAPICEELGVRGIAISLPGYGYTDMKPGRQVKDWPAEDLAAVLAQESVDKFMITGHSQGTVHAMAAAAHYPDRCVGMGLYAPLLPAPLCKELGIKGSLGMESLPTTEKLRKVYMGWYFALMHLTLVTFSPFLPLQALRGRGVGGAGLAGEDKMKKQLGDSLVRAVARGGVGGTWETAVDVCYHWGFDVRDMQVKNVCIWHASDDNMCLPAHGKWLAEMFQARNEVRVDFRDENERCGHFTYSRGKYQQAEHSLIKSLVDGLG